MARCTYCDYLPLHFLLHQFSVMLCPLPKITLIKIIGDLLTAKFSVPVLLHFRAIFNMSDPWSFRTLPGSCFFLPRWPFHSVSFASSPPSYPPSVGALLGSAFSPFLLPVFIHSFGDFIPNYYLNPNLSQNSRLTHHAYCSLSNKHSDSVFPNLTPLPAPPPQTHVVYSLSSVS